MGSKGSNSGNMAPVQAQNQQINTTTNQNTGQVQSYAPTGAGYMQNALQQGQAAAQSPFQAPVAPVQGFSQDQMDAFGRVRNAQGMAQPYYNNAQNLFNKSAQGPDINQFFNPYAGAVMGNLKDLFGEQMSQNDGRLTQAAGGVGADRIAVGHAALAKQQGEVAGQTMASLYAPSLQAAMQEQNVLQTAGYGIGALGQQAQNSVFSGAQQQLGMGGLQQQLGQAQLNAPYQNQLARLAYPFQTAQFNAGITGSLAPGLGGTTAGQGYNAGQSLSHIVNDTSRPGPSRLSQILGIGAAGAGLAGAAGMFGSDSGSNPFGSSPSYGGGNWWGGDEYGGSGSNPLPGLSASDYGTGYDVGGAVEESPYDLPLEISHKPINIGAHSIVPDVKLASTDPHTSQLNLSPQPLPSVPGMHEPALPQQQQSSDSGNPISSILGIAKTVLPFFLKDGGRIPTYDEGGSTFDDQSDSAFPARAQPSPFEDAQWPYGPTGAPSQTATPEEPYRMPGQPAVDEWRKGADSAMSFASTGADRSAAAPTADDASPYSAGSAGPAEATLGRDRGLSASPWAALAAAGLGMMSGTSPYAAVNIGQGGMQGLKMLEEQRTASQKDTTIDQAAKRLELEAKHHEDQYTRQTVGQRQAQEQADRPYREMTLAQKAAADREKFVPAGSLITAGGEVHPVALNQNSGESIDTVTRKPPVAGDRVVPKNTKNIDDNDAEALANYYVKTGDASRLNGLGISGEARQRVQHFVTKAQKDLSVSDEELATRKAEWEGRKAGQRVLAVQEAKMGSAAIEAEGAIKLSRGVIERLPRTSFLPLNKLLQGYQTNSLNPDQTELLGRTQAIINTYSAVMSRGANITTDSARGHAEKLLNTAGNAETYNRQLDVMLQEIEMAKHSPAKMREFYRQQYGPKAVETAAATAPEGKPDGATYYKKLRASGMSPDDVYKKMREEGYTE